MPSVNILTVSRQVFCSCVNNELILNCDTSQLYQSVLMQVYCKAYCSVQQCNNNVLFLYNPGQDYYKDKQKKIHNNNTTQHNKNKNSQNECTDKKSIQKSQDFIKTVRSCFISNTLNFIFYCIILILFCIILYFS